jgi:N-acetylglutamate synthase
MMNAEIEWIERATLAAVAPSAIEEVEGWLLAFDPGVVGRAKSAAPIRHDHSPRACIPDIERRYASKDLPPMFRIADVAGLKAERDELTRLGYRHSKPTLVQIADASAAAAAFSGPSAQVDALADDEWASVFLGEGFDPIEGASRVQTLMRAHGSLFARVRDDDGRTAATGVLSLGHGWAIIHGMRTAQSHRGRGFATRVVATLARIALNQGFERMVLQVQTDNATAQHVYARCGFTTAWSYGYWTRAG